VGSSSASGTRRPAKMSQMPMPPVCSCWKRRCTGSWSISSHTRPGASMRETRKLVDAV